MRETTASNTFLVPAQEPANGAGPIGIARKAIAVLGIPLHALDWLSTGALAPVYAYLRRIAGPNDGLVPIASQY